MSPSVLSIQSHVVHGCVGNRAVGFCLERLGVSVDLLHTVQFSNHKRYPTTTGSVFTAATISDLYSGLEANGLANHSYVLTGYIGAADVLRSVVEIVQRAKQRNDVVFVCDPVMGDAGKLYVPSETLEIYRQEVIPVADVLLPNQYETELLTDVVVHNAATAAEACKKLHALGPSTVVITSVEDSEAAAGALTLFASTTTAQEKGHPRAFQIKIPKLDVHFNGAGDLFGALFVALSSQRKGQLDWVCGQATSRLHAVLKQSHEQRRSQPTPLEIDLVASQEALVTSNDSHSVFEVTALDGTAAFKRT